MTFRKALQNEVKLDEIFLAAYDKLIETVICPFIYDSLAIHERSTLLGEDDSAFEILYQRVPSLRIHIAGSDYHKRSHRDLEYGHQPGEINFWLPLTDTSGESHPTMEIEVAKSVDGTLYPYRPIRLSVGQLQMFHGALTFHRVLPNKTPHTRISLDFRVAPAKCFDHDWKQKWNKGKKNVDHTMKLFTMALKKL